MNTPAPSNSVVTDLQWYIDNWPNKRLLAQTCRAAIDEIQRMQSANTIGSDELVSRLRIIEDGLRRGYVPGKHCADDIAAAINAIQGATPDSERVAVLERAGRNLLPYLEWTIGPESPGHHPTMPSAVHEFRAALSQPLGSENGHG